MSLETERTHLRDLAESRMSKEEFERFKTDMAAFEARAQKQSLSGEEVARTYQEISRILDAKGERPLTPADRVVIAEQVMHQAAEPRSVSQGFHDTCTAATLESRMYTRSPSEAARLVAEVVTTGMFQTADGKVVQLDAKSLQPDSEARTNPAKDGERSHASQIFQVTALNIYWQTLSGNKPGQIRYEQLPDIKKGDLADPGERVKDHSQHPPAEVRINGKVPTGIPADTIVEMNRAITGKHEKGMVIVGEPGWPEDKDWVKVKSADDLRQTLAKLKQEGTLPVIVTVDNNHEPFLSDSQGFAATGTGDAKGKRAGHVVTITDYDERTGEVKIDNQFRRSSDRTMGVDDLYRATKAATSPENIQALQREVDENRAHNKVDTFKELDLLRLKHVAGAVSMVELYAKTKELVEETQERWRQEKKLGTFDADEERRVREKLDGVINELPLSMRISLRAALRK